MDLPLPHYSLSKVPKAFILGCDPTAFGKDKWIIEFKKVFDIGGDKRYFAAILANLKVLNLTMDDIYVQNLIPEYRDVESSKDKNWVKAAQGYISTRKAEFDKIDPSFKVPVFLTSELIYKALLNDNEKLQIAKDIYDDPEQFIIPSTMNKLGRPLGQFYRHPAYSMKNKPEIAAKVGVLMKEQRKIV